MRDTSKDWMFEACYEPRPLPRRPQPRIARGWLIFIALAFVAVIVGGMWGLNHA